MILVSLVNDIKDTPSINSNWEIFKTVPVENLMWGHYEFFLYSKFKAHWINGVNMFSKYGQHELANNSCTVCAGINDFNFSPLVERFKTLPPNTIVFDQFRRYEENKRWYMHESHSPATIPINFVASYSSFMKLVSVWKWIDSYNNEPEILDKDTMGQLLERTMWRTNIQYTSTKWDKDIPTKWNES